MQRIIFLLTSAFLLVGLAVSAAEKEATWGTVKQASTQVDDTLVPAAKPVVQTSEAVYYADHAPAGFYGEVQRHKNGINLKMHYPTGVRPDDAIPGHVYTVWMFLFEDPSKCADPAACHLITDDFVHFENGEFDKIATTGLIGPVAAGKATSSGVTFNGHIKKDQVYEEFFGTLSDPLNTQIGLLIQSHGPAIPGLIDAMMKHNGAGCDNLLAEFGLPLNPDHIGPNQCSDPFFIHFN